jgi:hypothetical protein
MVYGVMLHIKNPTNDGQKRPENVANITGMAIKFVE